MIAVLIENALNIGSMLIGTLIAYEIIPISVSDDKIEKWEKAKKLLKIICPIGLFAFILAAVLEHQGA